MFWTDKLADKIAEQYKDKIASGKPLVIRDEKTVSGRVHIGSLRGVAVHGAMSEVLTERGIPNTYYFEINDFDPMDGIPVYLDKEKYEPFMGKVLCNIPSPDGKAANYAEYFGEEFIGVIEKTGFKPVFTRSSEKYKSGAYNEVIKTALDHAADIRAIYKEVSGSVKGPEWYPLNVICENCGNVSTTRVLSWDGKEVEYECKDIEWAKGCDHKGKVEPIDGAAKLPWKVEWAAKFKIYNVDIEGAGKDHSTRGGSRDVAVNICRKVFNHTPPFNIPYEFFLVGGKKMSSSKGAGSSSKEISDLLPTPFLRFLLLREPMRAIDFVPDGDTVPLLYDAFDKAAETYFAKPDDDVARHFFLAHVEDERKKLEKLRFGRFSTVAYLVQMPHIDLVKEIEKIESVALNAAEIEVLKRRAENARFWLDTYAPEDFKFEIQANLPESAKNLSNEQKAVLKKVHGYVTAQEKLEGGELHTKLHEIKTESGIDAKLFFEALYLSILGKTSGPKAGWFLSVLDKDFLENRLNEASL